MGEILEGVISRLEKTSDTPELDSQVLIASLLNKPRSWVLAHTEEIIGREIVLSLEGLVIRLEGGEPLPYVLGTWEFFGLDFEVTTDVLIPRPETELLVERAIALLRGLADENREVNVLEVGTGSGCIAISLAHNVPNCRITASDISPAALSVALRNAKKYRMAERITFLQADLIPKSPKHLYSMIVANLPYIPTATLRNLKVTRHEPSLALDGGEDGLRLIRRLLNQVPAAIAPGGTVILEIEASKGAEAESAARKAFPKGVIHLYQDLAGLDRILEVQL